MVDDNSYTPVIFRLQSLATLAAGVVLAFTLSACSSGEGGETDGANNLQGGQQGTPNALTSAEQDEGWQLLFDGESLDQWTGLGRDAIPEGHWTVEDGAIRKVESGEVPTAEDGQPLEGGDIMTTETFSDYEFAFEWRVDAGANSGIKYNVSEEMSTTGEPPHGALGFEYQLLDDEGHPAADHAAKNTTAALYDLVASRPPAEKELKPVGEWNRSRIVVNGNRGEHWLNGQKQVEYELNTEHFDSLVQASKFSDIDGFATKRAGHIVLQDHSTPAWFRNIKIREL